LYFAAIRVEYIQQPGIQYISDVFAGHGCPAVFTLYTKLQKTIVSERSHEITEIIILWICGRRSASDLHHCSNQWPLRHPSSYIYRWL